MSTGNNGEKPHYSIGEVSEITGIRQSVLRFWETEFEELKPIKNKFGHRVYRDQDIAVILKIRRLLYEEGMTIKGAKAEIKSAKAPSIPVKYIRKLLYELLDQLKKE